MTTVLDNAKTQDPPIPPVPDGAVMVTLKIARFNPEEPDAAPVEVRSPPHAEEAKRPRVEGPVKVASGPWGLEEEWWADDPAGRDYWDVEIAGRGLYRIYRERATGAWYADGIYD